MAKKKQTAVRVEAIRHKDKRWRQPEQVRAFRDTWKLGIHCTWRTSATA